MDDSMDVALARSNSPDLPHHIRLACQACQRKKIKCDRNFPCGQCTRSNLQCVASTRKPRARHTGKRAADSELRTRISKLESLVENLSGDVGAPSTTAADQVQAPADRTDDASPAISKYMSSNFWSSLTGEVQALKDALEDEQGDEDEPTSPTTSTAPSSNSAEYDLIVCPPGSVFIMPGALPEPTPEMSARLCHIFCNHVDRLFKLYHAPTLQAFMVEGKPYLGNDASAPCNRALKAAVWFAAINTVSESECQMMFGQSREDQVSQFRKLVDIALAKADLMNTNDLATLQALATYIITGRLRDTSRRMWTLTALLVRLGRALGLHHETVARTPFETELRRRLWHIIRFIDVYGSWDRSTEMLIATGSFDTPKPKATNDCEFNEQSTSIPEHETGLTDMSFALLSHASTYQTHRVLSPESKPNGGDTWKDRLESAQKFADKTQETTLKYVDPSDPWQRMLAGVARSMIASLKLRAVRPLRKHPLSRPPRVDSPECLNMALDVLKASEAVHSDPGLAQFRWMVWVPWHPLAVALAALCAIRDTDLANEAWPYVEKTFARQSNHIADARNGMLWRPIEKLHKAASAFRDHREITPSEVSPPRLSSLPTASPAPFTMPPTPQLDPALGQSQINSQSIPGAMPTSGVLNAQMNIDLSSSSMMGDFDLTNNNMNWMDFQNIFDDMSTPAPQMNFTGFQWPGNVQPNGAGGNGWVDPMFPNVM